MVGTGTVGAAPQAWCGCGRREHGGADDARIGDQRPRSPIIPVWSPAIPRVVHWMCMPEISVRSRPSRRGVLGVAATGKRSRDENGPTVTSTGPTEAPLGGQPRYVQRTGRRPARGRSRGRGRASGGSGPEFARRVPARGRRSACARRSRCGSSWPHASRWCGRGRRTWSRSWAA